MKRMVGLTIIVFLTLSPCVGQLLPSNTMTIDLPGLPDGAIPLETTHIPAGTFTMGSPLDEQGRNANEGPQHEVTISKDFHIGRYEITVGQYTAFMKATGNEEGVDWEDSDCPLRRNDGNYQLNGPCGRSWDQPIVLVSWYGARDFCMWVEEQNSALLVRLPTEAEWEYACRAGTTTRFYWGNDLDYAQIDDYAWYGWNNQPSFTKKVGQKKPNAFGLYDMSGNVWEWCHDWYGEYPQERGVDPIGQNTSLYHIFRGGDWMSTPRYVRSAERAFGEPTHMETTIGFRIVVLRQDSNTSESN